MAIRDTKAFRGTSVELASGTVLRFRSEATGEARQWLPSPGRLWLERTPAERELSPELQLALDEHEIIEEEAAHLELDLLPADDTVEVVPARPVPAGFERVILYRDESNAVTWHFAENTAPLAARSLRAAAEPQRFVIPLRTAPARTAAEHDRRAHLRSFSLLGRKVLKLLLLPIAAMLLDDPLNALVRAWEKRRRRDLLRTLTPENYKTAGPQPFTDWDRLASGRALLVIHGIFSSTQGMLSRLARDQMEALHAQYDGRVIAFDHFTLSRDPEENASWFFDELRRRAGNRRFTFDVLCHSRGGIVARAMRERGDILDLAGTVTVNKIFFAATPNRGSALADENRLVELIDVFTNIATAVTGGAVAISLELVLSLVKLLAYIGVTRVPGIHAMRPGADDYINGTLNGRKIAEPWEYAAVAAQYEPSDADDGPLFTIADAVVDRVFGNADNDLVVPTEGVFAGLGAQRIDIDHEVYSEGIWHTELFANRVTIERALDHYRRTGGGATLSSPDAEIEVRDIVGDATGVIFERAVPREIELDAIELEAMPIDDGPLDAAEPDTPVAAAEAKPEVTVVREPRIDFHERVQPNVPTELVVALDEKVAAAAAGALAVRIVGGADFVEIGVQLFAPGFKVTDSDTRTMTVRRARNPDDERVTFMLVANPVVKTTRREIVASFSIGGVSIGGVSQVTWVLGEGDPVDWQPSIVPSFKPTAAERARADLTIIVSDRNSDGTMYSMKITSHVPGFIVESKSMGDFEAPQNGILDYMNSMLQVLFAARPSRRLPLDQLETAMKDWNSSMMNQLRDVGIKLWGYLPSEFQRFYFELRDAGVAPRSIHIVSDDMLFPWELVIPFRQVGARRDELAPLGTAHVVGRWQPGIFIKPEPQSFPLTKIAIVNPQYTGDKQLPAAAQEALDLAAFFGAACEVVRPCDVATVRARVLDAAGVQLLHFTGHAQFYEQNADQSSLLLDKLETLTASTLANGKFTAGAPIVVINACSAGKAGMVASRAGGFAERCLEMGCAAVLAAYWEISDRSAAAFSLAFYNKLKRGRTFGEALQELRLEKEDDPTYQAYTFFGDPLARIVF